jgi:hypothetical protein
MSEELKPCPFCGGPARKSMLLPGPGNRYGCGECGIDACNLEDWNRRKPGPATREVLELFKGLVIRSPRDNVAVAHVTMRAMIDESEG